MAKSTKSTTARKAAARKSSGKPTASATAKAPAKSAPAKVSIGALRDGTTAVKINPAHAYRVAAPHNADWWATVTKTCQAHHGKATVAALTEAKVPGIFISYCVRRGWCLPA